MSGSRRNSPFEYRDHWLGRVDGTPCWYVFWDEAPRKRRRATLGTDQLPAAKERLVSWVHEHGHLEPEDPRHVTVAAVLDRYWHKHAKGQRSAEQARIAAAQILQFLGAATVSELTPQRQERFRAWLAQGRSPDTVSRVLSVLRAALRWSEKHQELTRVPFIFDVKRAAPRERFLSVEELARLHDGFDCDYGRMFFWLQLGTAGRKEAILELTRFRCDTRRRLIRLNPEGRGQTAKRRATLPLVPYLASLVEAGRDGYLVHHNGAKLGDIKAAWRRARTKAGLGSDVTTT
ncbi:MAG TPA: hypothetical protein VFY87_19205, partial [Geminicoccaceae bacterium]|nr:hypothetical protein [Geminicoccaceae bacterium]